MSKSGQPNPDMKRAIQSDFAQALRYARKARALTQEDFDEVSSRVYVSALERGVKQPTLAKVDVLAAKLDLHPLTLLALSYCSKPSIEEVQQLCKRINAEMAKLVSGD